MSEHQFLYWLRGFLTDRPELSAAQVDLVRVKLEETFNPHPIMNEKNTRLQKEIEIPRVGKCWVGPSDYNNYTRMSEYIGDGPINKDL